MADDSAYLTQGASGAASGASAGSSFGPWGAVIGGGIGLASGLYGANQAGKAGEQSAAAQLAAQQYAQQQYAQGRTDLAPYMAAGSQAVGQLGGIADQSQPGFDYQQQPFSFDRNIDPGAVTLMQQAAQAINASSLAKGSIGGGLARSLNTEIGNQSNTAFQGAFGRHMATSQMLNDQAQQKYGRNLGWQQNQFGQHEAIAGMGAKSAGGLAGFGAQLGQYGGDRIAGAGESRAAGTLGAANALVGGATSFANQIAKGYGAYQGQQQNPYAAPYQDPYAMEGANG